MTAGPEPVRLKDSVGRWVLLATVLGSGMAMLDGTVVNVALPALAEDLDASMAGLQWTINAYTLTLAGLILLGGSLGDRFGRRRLFLIGVVWFAIASALCGLAPSVEVLIGARALQGMGGALLTPGSLALIQASFVPDDRPRAVGAWSGLGGIAGAIGPFVGGGLVQTVGWRWVFLINLPLAAVICWITVRHVPESVNDEAHGRFDVVGAALGALGLAAVTYTLTEAPAGDLAPGVLVASGLLGVAALAGFVIVERRRSAGIGPQPMLPLDVFGSRQFTAINVVTFIVYAAMGVQFFLLVVHLQVVAGFAPTIAGTALIPVTLLMLVLSSRAGALAQRIGPRLPITVGLILGGLGLLLSIRIGPDASYVGDVLPAVVVFGLGLSAMVAPLTSTVLASADTRHAGVASGVNNAVSRVGGLLAVAAIPPAVGLTGEAYRAPERFASGFTTAMVICAALMFTGAALTLALVRDPGVRRCPEADRPQARTHCAAEATPLEPDHETTGVSDR